MESVSVEGSRKRKHCDTEIKSSKKPKLEEAGVDVDNDNGSKEKETRPLNVISKYVPVFGIIIYRDLYVCVSCVLDCVYILYVRTYVCVCTYVCMYICTCMCAYICLYVCVCVSVCVYVRTYVRMYICTCTYIRHMCMYVHTYVRVCICMYVYMCIYDSWDFQDQDLEMVCKITINFDT